MVMKAFPIITKAVTAPLYPVGEQFKRCNKTCYNSSGRCWGGGEFNYVISALFSVGHEKFK